MELDTDHYKGNAPGACMLEGCDAPDAGRSAHGRGAAVDAARAAEQLQPHAVIASRPSVGTPATHVRLNIYPDGGVARLRLFGTRAAVAT